MSPTDLNEVTEIALSLGGTERRMVLRVIAAAETAMCSVVDLRRQLAACSEARLREHEATKKAVAERDEALADRDEARRQRDNAYAKLELITADSNDEDT